TLLLRPSSSVSLLSFFSLLHFLIFFFFFFNDPATTEIYPLSLHDALPICLIMSLLELAGESPWAISVGPLAIGLTILQISQVHRSEEHTSELQSLTNLVCRLLLEKKKKKKLTNNSSLYIMCYDTICSALVI